MDSAGTFLAGFAALLTAFNALWSRRRERRHSSVLEEINHAVNNVPVDAAGEKQPPLWRRIDGLREDVGHLGGLLDAHAATDAENFAQILRRLPVKDPE